MIEFVRGKLAEVNESMAVLETGGVGFGIYVNGRDAASLSGKKEEVLLYTYLNVREDAMQLFGFLSRDDLRVFKLLLGVNGVGPKAAMGILTALSANDLKFAVLSDDAKTISMAPGIGKKTAQKMILELKDKFSLEEAFEEKYQENTAAVSGGQTDSQAEAVQALVALGYSGSDALKAVKAVDGSESLDTEAILKAALKNMSF